MANDCSIFSKAYICTTLSVITNESPSQAQSPKEDEEEDAPGVPWVEYVLFQLANKGPVNYWTTCAPYPGLLWFSVPAFSTISEMFGCVASFQFHAAYLAPSWRWVFVAGLRLQATTAARVLFREEEEEDLNNITALDWRRDPEKPVMPGWDSVVPTPLW